MTDADDIDVVLAALCAGEPEAVNRLFGTLYEELRRVAHGQRLRWQGNDTLSTTVLVHEAYLKLSNGGGGRWRDRAHFHAVASRAMRHILVNYAQRQCAAKRGGGAPHVALTETTPVPAEVAEELLQLDAAVQELAEVHPRQARVVECRFFAGLGIRETAEALGISTATVERDWAVASAWLRRVLAEPDGAAG
jgi:RNA polymerase sigma factor (TIGR02999 family)